MLTNEKKLKMTGGTQREKQNNKIYTHTAWWWVKMYTENLMPLSYFQFPCSLSAQTVL